MRAALENSVFISEQANMAAANFPPTPPHLNMGILLPALNYPKFILNQYQEVGQKPCHLAKPKNRMQTEILWGATYTNNKLQK